MKRPKHDLSFSSASAYEDCPGYYDRIYNQGLDKGKSDRLRAGQFYHIVFAEINRLAMKDKEYVVDDIKKIYDKEWKKYNLGFAIYQAGWEATLGYAEKVFGSVDQIVGVEYEITAIIPHKTGDIKMLGYIDRLDKIPGGFKVWDFKSSAMLSSKEELDNDFQTTLYAFYLKKKYPETETIKTSRYSILAKMEMEVTKTNESIDRIEGYIIDLWDKILSDKKFEPKRCKRCEYCPKKCLVYYEYLKKNQIPEVITLEQKASLYLDIGNQMSILNKEKEFLREQIAGEIDKNLGQPIRIKDNEWYVGQIPEARIPEHIKLPYSVLRNRKLRGEKR